MGGVLGALFAMWATSGLLSLAPAGIPRVAEVHADLRFVAFAALLSLFIGLAAGFLPSLRLSRRCEGGGTLLSGVRSSGARGRDRARRWLVVAEVAFSLVLLVGAGLMVRTLAALNQIDPGFDPKALIAAHLALPEPRYSDDAQIAQFVRNVEEGVRARPGVQAAGLVLSLPIRSGISGTFYFHVEGWDPEENQQPLAGIQIASPGYFETLGIPLKEGRLPNGDDRAGNAGVAVVNEAWVQRFFPGEDVLGRRVTWSDPDGEDVEWSTIVGVVGDALQGGLDREPRPEIFNLYDQAPLPFMTLVARSEGEAGPLASVLTEAVMDVDPRVPLYGMATMEERLSDSLGRRRFAMILLSTFGIVALLLAAVGLYGVLRYSVSQRSREMGIRVALGAPSSNILREIMGEGLALTLVGLAVGLVLAFPSARLMSDLVFRVGTGDPATFAACGILLVAVALAACGPPSLRASRTDPLEVLKEE
jgi:predicted permease